MRKPLLRSEFLTATIYRLGIAVLALIDFAPIMRTPFWGDDEPNSQRLAVLQFLHQSAIRCAWDATKLWVHSEGRFFPVSAIENAYIFVLLHDRIAYKAFETAVVLAVAVSVGVLAGELTRNPAHRVVGALAFLSMVQVRHWYDPTIGFGLLLPSVTLKIMVALVLSLRLPTYGRTKRALTGMSVSLLWTAAILQYEVAFFVYPAFLVCVLFSRIDFAFKRRVSAIQWTLWPTAMVFIGNFVLRTRAHPSVGYQVGLHAGTVLQTLGKQIVAGLPTTSSFLYRQSSWSQRSWIVGLGTAFLLFLAMINSIEMTNGSRTKSHRSLFGLGLGILVTASLPAALSVKWQQQLTWGSGYLFVFIEYVGTSLILVSAIIKCLSISEGWRRHSQIGLLILLASLVGMSAGIHAAGLKDVSLRTEPITWKRELFEESVRDGFFNEIPTGASIISGSYTPNGWFNPWYYQWLGGYRSHRLSGTTNGMVASCTEAEKEGRCRLTGPWWGFAELPTGTRDTVDALGLYTHLDADPLGTAMMPGSIKLIAHKYQQLPLNCRWYLERTRSGNWIGSCGQDVTTLAQVSSLLNPTG